MFGFLSEFREFLIKFFIEIKTNVQIDENLVTELRAHLTKLDQEWNSFIAAETFDKNSPIFRGKLSIYVGKFQLENVDSALKEVYKDYASPVQRSVFLIISDICKVE